MPKTNKVKFNIRNVHYALLTLAEDGSYSFGEGEQNEPLPAQETKTPSVFGFSDKVTSTFGDTVEEDLARKTQDLSGFFEVERGNENGSK